MSTADDDSVLYSDQIIQFLDITGSTPEQALNYLRVNEGDVEQAISMYFANGGTDLINTDTYTPVPIIEDSTNLASSPQLNTLNDFYDEDGVRAPIAPQQSTMINPEHYGNQSHWVDEPELTGEYFSNDSISSSRLTRPFSGRDNFRLQRGGVNPFSEDDNVDETTDKIVDKRTQLENMFRILVTIQDTDNFSCHTMLRDVWNNADVQKLIKEKFIFCYYLSTHREGIRHKITYPYTDYPYTAIIDPVTGERVAKWIEALEAKSFMELGTKNDSINSKKIFFIVNEFLNQKMEAQSVQPDKKKQKSVLELSEEEQLRLAIEASIGAKAGESSSSHEADADRKTKIMYCFILNLLIAFNRIIGNIKPEPTAGDITRIQFRYPDGSRDVRKFLKSDKVLNLFEYVKGNEKKIGDQKFDVKLTI
ncbi:hypothetical protein HK099_000974 [Clydaea vesicula]|uniref:UBX domain-containing protein n=1 Tax=Clydaea vesicula TaxID=447962 RepID=A0AAD5XXD4_9FUNG|nr:hypothetical protein HK099_000974 [Clydaea vesicula]